MKIIKFNDMRFLLFLPVLGVCMLFIAACGGKGDGKAKLPSNFNSIGDAGRVEYMMSRISPDSLACFILRGALGQIEGVRIDTLGMATNAAYMKLTGDSTVSFANAYDSLYNVLPLSDKARILSMAGSDDPQGLGYRLGLEYVGDVRDNNKDVQSVIKEIEALREACGNDTSTYTRFMVGFRTALSVDRGRDLKKEIYDYFMEDK